MAKTSLKALFLDKLTRWLTKEVVPCRDFPLSDFAKIQYEIRPCDVLLIEGRTRISEVIKIITQSSWSHACLYIGRIRDIENPLLNQRLQKYYTGDPNEQLIIESILGKGTTVTPLSHYQHEHIRICRPKGLSRLDVQQVIGYTIGKLGTAYDLRQIFDLARFLLPWHILPRRWRSTLFTYNAGDSTKQTCPALIASAFNTVHFPILPVLKTDKEHGIQLFQRNPRLYTPSDFDFSPFFEIIKYPIFELSERGVYRDLPWNRQENLSYSGEEANLALTTEEPSQPLPAPTNPTEETAPASAANKKPLSRIWDFFD